MLKCFSTLSRSSRKRVALSHLLNFSSAYTIPSPKVPRELKPNTHRVFHLGEAAEQGRGEAGTLLPVLLRSGAVTVIAALMVIVIVLNVSCSLRHGCRV